MKVKFNSVLITVALLFSMYTHVSAQVCATPGRDGNATTSGTLNTYFPGLTATLNSSSTSILLGAAQGASVPIATGDLLLIIQMQGADIDFSNSDAYGNAVAGLPGSGYLTGAANFLAGNFEYIRATSNVPLGGGTLTFTPALTRNYARRDYAASLNGQSRYQVIRVPQYNNLTLSGNITAAVWNGETGGVIAIDAIATINFASFSINASAAGFRGGGGRSLGGGTGSNSDFVTLSTNNANGQKGEGIAGTPAFVWNGVVADGTAGVINTTTEGYPNGSSSRGAPGNAGGGGQDGSPGGNSQNAGGGGGGNGGAGGLGGNSWSSNLPIGGNGGGAFNERAFNRIVMGGGGGAGNANNSGTNPHLLSGARGGGIVIVKARWISGSGTINVNGQSAQLNNPDCCDDGAGGGGAAGSVLFTALNTAGMANITVTANGGNGGNTRNSNDHGPGGGGGGGVIFANGSLNLSSSVTGGSNGTGNASLPYGAAGGANGFISQNNAANDPPTATAGYKCSFALPAEGLKLVTKLENGNVLLFWETISESNTDYFQIERSSNGTDFTETGMQVAAAGNSSVQKQYTAKDAVTGFRNEGIIYYRLKLFNTDGTYKYSNITVIRLGGTGGIKMWPNPFKENVFIQFNSEAVAPVQLRIMNASGKVVSIVSEVAMRGSNQFIIPVPESLSSGTYLFQMINQRSGEILFTQKLTKQ